MSLGQRSLTLWAVVAAMVAAIALMATIAHQRSQPPPDAYTAVAGVLFVNETSDHKYDRALRASIRIFQERTQIQLGIILKQALPAHSSIETYAPAAFKQVRLGEAFAGKGILLVWSEQERLFKIETAYALEAVFPDLLCHQLEAGARTYMLAKSAFARRDFLTEVIVTLGLHYLDYRKTGVLSDLMLPNTEPSHQLSRFLSGGGGIVGRGYAHSLEQVQRELIGLPRGDSPDLQPAASPELAVQRYLASLAMGIGAPQLGLLTEGSSYFRMNKPHAPGYLQRIHAYYRKAQPYQLRVQGDLAAAVFPKGTPVLPILLQKNEQGLWLVDEAKAWVYFHLSEDGTSIPKYGNSPYAFSWQQDTGRAPITPAYFDRSPGPALIKPPFDLKALIAAAERDIAQSPDHAAHYLRLAELLHFEMYWLEAAAPLYEKVLELTPARHDIRWRLVDVYMNLTDIDGLERQYITLLKNTPEDRLVAGYYSWFKKIYP
jgi:hypothetical protein